MKENIEMKVKKAYVKPQMIAQAVCCSSTTIKVCCGMGSTSTCSINRSRIS